jgi:hypothetical protein
MACAFAEHWPGVQEGDGQATEGNHLAILLLAWAYILSARWVELQSPYGLRGLLPSSCRELVDNLP